MNHDSYSKTLSQNLRAIRRSKSLTTTDLAKILGVSQAKISYIEHGKGILSARDIAILSRRLDVPVIEFFRGLDQPENKKEGGDLPNQLAYFGAKLLAKTGGVSLAPAPFEEVFSQALGFMEDDRLHGAFCAAWILYAAKKEIKMARIFALTGNNPFLVQRIAVEAQTCLQIIERLNRQEKLVGPRAKRQIETTLAVALGMIEEKHRAPLPSQSEISSLAEFVKECIHAED